jgi:hypothetical protein
MFNVQSENFIIKIIFLLFVATLFLIPGLFGLFKGIITFKARNNEIIKFTGSKARIYGVLFLIAFLGWLYLISKVI